MMAKLLFFNIFVEKDKHLNAAEFRVGKEGNQASWEEIWTSTSNLKSK